MKLSAVIPCFSVTEDLKDMALDCAKRIRDQVDELIITEDSDRYWSDLHQIADHYLLHPRLGYTKNSNLGWKMATGNYVAQINSDALLLEGNMRDLMVEGIGVPWVIEAMQQNRGSTSQAIGIFFVVPRPVFEKWGVWDVTFGDDYNTELLDRYQFHGNPLIRIDSVKVSHPLGGATSYRALGGFTGRKSMV